MQLVTFFNQNPWTKSGLDKFQFATLPRIFLKPFSMISTSSCFVTLTSLCKSFNHFTPYVARKRRFFSVWLIIITSFSFLIQYSIKLPLIIPKHSVLSKPIYSFLILPNVYCKSYIPLLQFFNNSTLCFYSNTVFFSNVSQVFTLLTSLSFDNCN